METRNEEGKPARKQQQSWLKKKSMLNKVEDCTKRNKRILEHICGEK